MFLKKEKLLKELLILVTILTYAYLVNWFSGNIGVMPIDTFGFLDSGYSILQGHLPIRDFWIFTGLLVDYMEAIFLFIFGNNWNSHLAHSSFMNIIATTGVYLFLKELNLKSNLIFFYTICFATLCYPVTGTPFAYVHAYIFSLLAIFNFIIAIKKQNNILWFIFPFICFFAFLSMQTPTAYVLIILFILLVHYYVKYKNLANLKFFITGCVSSCFLFLLFLYFTKTPFSNFVYQYILFPLTIGEGRISSNELAYISLIDQLNFKRIFGEFKFIHIFLLPLIYVSIKNIKKKEEETNLINLTVILSVLAFLFNQLITANQIYIFSLIPIIAATLHFNLNKLNLNSKLFYLIIFIVLISTIKFHYRYNIDRKFDDIENVNKSNAIHAKLIHPNFKNLKWITRFDEPEIELSVIKKAIETINNDKREKTLITHYQFMSAILDKRLNILNRWYLWDNNTHPTENHKYFEFYKKLINKNIRENKVRVIYLLGEENEILFDNVKNYFTEVCFESKTIIQKKFSLHKIVNCKK